MAEEEKKESEEVKEQEEKTEEQPQETDKVNAIAILSYIGILFLVPLLAAKDDEFAQYHAKQGLVLFIVAVVGSFIGMVPILGWLLLPFFGLAVLILAIMGIINVFKGERKELPFIGQYANNFKV